MRLKESWTCIETRGPATGMQGLGTHSEFVVRLWEDYPALAEYCADSSKFSNFQAESLD